jgi:hypothetical protein
MSNYDYEPTKADIERKIIEDRGKSENWHKMLVKLYQLTSMSGINDRHFDAKLEEVKDLVKSRMYDLRER